MTATAQKQTPLPEMVPLFPLPRVILLPRVQLPLNIFEPRYLAMVDTALSAGRMIGIVQEKTDGSVFDVACAGRITSFSEEEGGRYLVTLTGVCRFDLQGAPVADAGGFLRIGANWARWRGDLEVDAEMDVCREEVMQSLRTYLKKMDMSCTQWEQMRDMCCEKLISTLSVICPFAADEKQTLLEAPTVAARARVLLGLLEIAARKHEDERACTTCH